MILSDSEIKKLIGEQHLIEDHDPNLVKYCGYELRLGKVFMPESGEVQWVEDETKVSLKDTSALIAPRVRATGLSSGSKCWVIGPSETMVVVTKETIKMPTHLCATYGQLNRLANHGLMILNTSIVEPGYQGPLSCVLVDFSSQRLTLFPAQPIAKINFHLLQGPVDKLQAGTDRDSYEAHLSENAMKFPRSFLDITGVEERVTKKMGSVVRRGVAFGGIVIAALLLWSQLEGVLSNFIWKRTGLMSTTKQAELETMRRDLQNEQTIWDLKKEIEQLKSRANELERATSGPRGPAGGRSGVGR